MIATSPYRSAQCLDISGCLDLIRLGLSWIFIIHSHAHELHEQQCYQSSLHKEQAWYFIAATHPLMQANIIILVTICLHPIALSAYQI